MAGSGQGRGRYVVARFVQAVPLILAILVVNFALIHFSPGDAVTVLVGDYPVPEEHRQRVIEEFGLDRSMPEQFVRYVASVARGDLGYSFVNRRPVLDLIVSRLWATLLLLGTAMAIAMVVGVALGVAAASRPGSGGDTLISVAGLAGHSMPVFWLGQLLVILFALQLGWLPTGGMEDLRQASTGMARVTEIARHLVMPAFVLSTRYVAINMRITRSSLLEAMQSNYVQTAVAKGLGHRSVLLRHGLRNALLPVVTVIGYNIGFALGGSVLVETVFSWPGIGRLLFSSIGSRDYPVVLGVFLMVTVFVVIVNLVTDILYSYLDPRIRY